MRCLPKRAADRVCERGLGEDYRVFGPRVAGTALWELAAGEIQKAFLSWRFVFEKCIVCGWLSPAGLKGAKIGLGKGMRGVFGF